MTRFHLAKSLVLVIELGLLLAGVIESGRAQITITTKDMFSKEGQYYKMYSNFVKHSSSEDEAGEEVDVSDYIGEDGEDQVWDFREGPDDEEIRFDYVKPSEIDTDVEFEGATIVERATFKSTDAQKSLFLDMKKGVGRFVYGVHPVVYEAKPSVVFGNRLLDFPAVIKYEDEWDSTTSFEIEVESLGLVVPTKLVYESSMRVDAHGIVMLPEQDFHDCLRINELVKYDQFVKIPGLGDDWMNAGQPTSVITTGWQRTWESWCRLRPHKIRLLSRMISQRPLPCGGNSRTIMESRAMWQSRSRGLKSLWTPREPRFVELKKAENAVAYMVQYTDNLTANNWKDLKETSGNFALDSISSEKQRFYRIVSLE